MTYLESPGVSLDRRSVLALPALLGLRAPAAARASERLDFAAFTAHCKALVDEHLKGDGSLHEALLLDLAQAGARLDARDVPRPQLGAFGGYEPKVGFGPVHRAPPFLVIQWQLDPHAVLPPHNHTPVHVVSLCLEGECLVRHFDIEGEAPPVGQSGDFHLRQTRAQLLRAGHASSLTPQRDNIHTFRAGPAGALGIDLNVLLPGEGDWSMIASEGLADDGYAPRLKARWIGKPKK